MKPTKHTATKSLLSPRPLPSRRTTKGKMVVTWWWILFILGTLGGTTVVSGQQQTETQVTTQEDQDQGQGEKNSTAQMTVIMDPLLPNIPPFAGGIMDDGAAIVAGVALPKPTKISLTAAVIPTPPFGIVDPISGEISGFHYDLIQIFKQYAHEMDNIDLDITLVKSVEEKYGPALDLIANDCNTTINPNSYDRCDMYDLILGDYYVNQERAMRINFAPAYLRTSMTTIKYINKKLTPDYTTMQQAIKANATVCALDGTYLSKFIMEKYPTANWHLCTPSLDACIDDVKNEVCVLYVEDEHKLKYRAVHDFTLEVTREVFSRQYYVWPMSYRKVSKDVEIMLKKYMYTAVATSKLDDLYYKYFEIKTCPIGAAGVDCELPCDPDHGTSNKHGTCVCTSSRYTGEDCSIELPTELNLIPTSLKTAGFVAFVMNLVACVVCAIWLLWKRNAPALKFAQPYFLVLVLLGCIISSATIVALSKEDVGDGPVPACMAIPWLYSIGFCITFGTLFAKIRRTYILFQSAANMKRVAVTVPETLAVIGSILLVDCVVLVTWTVYDPLTWKRNVVSSDVFGHPMESIGQCTSEHWGPFAGTIAALHFCLLLVACWYCYVSRNIPDKFSEGKYLTVAMISNMQIFVVGIPVLLIIGSDPGTGFFVRSVIVWMNDIVVVGLIFGHLIYAVHWQNGGDVDGNKPEALRSQVNSALRRYSQSQKPTQSRVSILKSKSSFSTPVSEYSDQFNVSDYRNAAREASAQLKAAGVFNIESIAEDTAQTSSPSQSTLYKKTSWIGVEDVTVNNNKTSMLESIADSTGSSTRSASNDHSAPSQRTSSTNKSLSMMTPSERLAELKKCQDLMPEADYQKKYKEITSSIMSPSDRLAQLKSCEELMDPEDYKRKYNEIIKEI